MRRATKKSALSAEGSVPSSSTLRRSPRFNEKARPSAVVIAAKKNARLRQNNKKPLDVVVRDIYQTAREAKDMIRRGTGLVFDKQMVNHHCLWDANYPECPDRFSSVLDRCTTLGLVDRCVPITPREATEGEIVTKHSPNHLKILQYTDGMKDKVLLETLSSKYDAIYVHPSTYHQALVAAGSTIELVNAISSKKIQNGMAIIRPPGHHAMKTEYCGYCFFNNVALAAHQALELGGFSRVLIVDWDVHHGQATQQMFYDDARVVYFSIHRYEHGTFWPNLRESDFHYIGEGRGKGYNFNVPLNKTHMSDAEYMTIFHQVLLPMAVEGEMEVTPACYAHLLSTLLPLAGGKVAVVLEGGYCLKSLAEGAALTLRCLLGDPCPLLPKLPAPCNSVRDIILNLIYAHREYWQCFQFHDTYNIRTEPQVPVLSTEKSDGSVSPSAEASSPVDEPTVVARHLPVVKYLGSEERPQSFETRNCYPVQNSEVIKANDARLNTLITNTKLSFAPHRVCYVYDERMMKHKNPVEPSHPEKPERISSIYFRHEEYGLLERCLRLPARPVSQEELQLLHTPAHIEQMADTAAMKPRELHKLQDQFRSVYLHPDTYDCACLAAGSLLQVVDSVLNGESQSGVAIVRPPGHHAEEDEPCGFCVFNSVSIAAKYAVEVHGVKRVLLLDWDVHHGNGSQHFFESDPQVLYISIHRYDNGSFFPGSRDANYTVVGTGPGIGFNVNIPWNKRGMTDADYMAAFHHLVMPIAYQFAPDLVLVSAGFDAAVGDPLGGCKVTPEAYGYFTHWLMGLANGRVILSLEGGYNVSSISYAMTMCTKALLGDPLPPLLPRMGPCSSAVTTIKNVIRTHSRYWPCLKFDLALPVQNVLPVADKSVPVDVESGVLSILESRKSSEVKNVNFPISNTIVELSHIAISQSPECNVSKDEIPSSLAKLSIKDSTPCSGNLDETVHSSPCIISLKDQTRSLESPMELSEDSNLVISSPSSPEGSNHVWSQMSSSASESLEMVTDNTGSFDYNTRSESLDSGQGDVCAKPVEASSDKVEGKKGPELGLGLGDEVRVRTAANRDQHPSGGSRRSSQEQAPGPSSSGGASGGGASGGPNNLLDYLSGNMQLLLTGQMYAVVPLLSCPHVDTVREVPGIGVDVHTPCMECGSTLENWVCLMCYTVHCGRYINEHMMEHGLTTSHPLTLSFSDLSVWCYGCEAYIDNQAFFHAKNAVHRSKFGEDMPFSYGD